MYEGKMSFKKLFVSKNLVLENKIISGGILVNDDGRISKILDEQGVRVFKNRDVLQIHDVGDYFIMAGIIDSHVHVNEPGRTDWEGFETATKAAAAGGITTIVDMPLNSIPPTTTMKNLETKLNAAKHQIYVDVAFWGGLVPDNDEELLRMLNVGVPGFKAFMCCSGVDEFEKVNFKDIEQAFVRLQNTKAVLLFHAEIAEKMESIGDPTLYETYLKTRPPTMELKAIEQIIFFAKKYRVQAHIVHLSTAEALPIIEKAKQEGVKITVETCHHYLTLAAENVPEKATQFKCAPPIRDLKNQELLWDAIKTRTLDLVASDHSPCTSDLKLLSPDQKDFGNFLKAWGGISSLQFGLSLFWTNLKKRNLSIFEINKFMSRATAKLAGLHNVKGSLRPNYDADFVIWDPDSTIKIEESMILHKHKVTPYLGLELHGKIIGTVVRGKIVYENGKNFGAPVGKLLINKTNL